MATKFVRAKDPVSGHEFTTNEAHAKASGLEIVKGDAVDSLGHALPAKHNLDLGGRRAANAQKEG